VVIRCIDEFDYVFIYIITFSKLVLRLVSWVYMIIEMIEMKIVVELCNSIGSHLCFVELLCNRFNGGSK
jgi:hypothetical protein